MRWLAALFACMSLAFVALAQDTGGVVQISNHPALGPILVAPDGRTLYTFANDAPGVSNCVAQCLEAWPAYTVDVNTVLTAAPGVPGTINVIVQADGRLHVTYDDQPLYFYASDAAPGDATGQGVGSVWFVVPIATASQPASEFLLAVGVNRDLGSILTASSGLTLYTFANDVPGVSNCVGQCVEAWPPYTVDAAAVLNSAPGIGGAITTLARSDGAAQVMLDNRPLYFYVGDAAPGDVTGQGIGNVWFTVPLDALRTGGPEGRTLLVAANGRTLYTFANDESNWSNCVGDCAVNWPPLTSASETPPLASIGIQGALGTSLRADGTYHVTFGGRPLYFFANDAQPGDTNGDGAGGVWSVINVTEVVGLGGNASLGSFAVATNGRTVYVFANDTTGTSTCVDACAQNWPPLTVPAGFSPVALGYLPGTLGTTGRADGSLQVTLDGRPLYFFANDSRPGDANGNGAGGTWSVIPFDLPFIAPATCAVVPVGQSANLRAQPSTSALTVRSIGQGEIVDVNAQTISEGFVWWQVTSGEWVRSDVVTEVTSCAAMPSVTAPPVQVAPQQPGQPAAPVSTPEVAETPEVDG